MKARICDRIEMLHGIAIRSQIIKQATKLYTIKIWTILFGREGTVNTIKIWAIWFVHEQLTLWQAATCSCHENLIIHCSSEQFDLCMNSWPCGGRQHVILPWKFNNSLLKMSNFFHYKTSQLVFDTMVASLKCHMG
jgi:hypothetical protein